MAKRKFAGTLGAIASILKSIVILLLIAAIAWGVYTYFFAPKSSNEILSTISHTISNLKENVKELSTVKFYYTDVFSTEKQSKVFGIGIPLTYNRIIATYDGVIFVGIDMANIDITVNEKEIVVKVPNAKILSHELKLESAKYYDDTKSLLMPLTNADATKLLAERKNEIQNEKVTNEILLEAKEGAKKIIKHLLSVSPDVSNNYVIKFID